MTNKEPVKGKLMFNDHVGLTNSVLEGYKKNTRRTEASLQRMIMKYEDKYLVPFCIISQYYDYGLERLVLRTPNEALYLKPRFLLGEKVAVAQSYRDCGYDPSFMQKTFVKKPTIFPGFSTAPMQGWVNLPLEHHKGWANKMFVLPQLMPNNIRITGIKTEQLQDISPQDCLAEGIRLEQPFGYTFDGYGNCKYSVRYNTSPIGAFAALIDRTSGKGTWDSNPWVVVYSFELQN